MKTDFHTLKMYLKNTSSYRLKRYSILHTWDQQSQQLTGRNLAPSSMTRKFQEIKSGYGSYDHYTIQVVFDDDTSSKHEIDFYYNSLWRHNKVILDIHDNYIDCNYIPQNSDIEEVDHHYERWD